MIKVIYERSVYVTRGLLMGGRMFEPLKYIEQRYVYYKSLLNMHHTHKHPVQNSVYITVKRIRPLNIQKAH